MSLDMIENGETFRTLCDAMANGITTYSSSDGQRFVLTGMNSSGEQMSGVSFQDIAGKEVREVFPGVVAMGLYDALRRVWATGTVENLSAAFYDAQGVSRCYENHVYKISATEIAAVYNDITVQKRAMDELSRSEEQLRVLFEASQAGIILVDPAGTITLANSRMAEMFGCTMEELIGSRYPEHVHPEHLSQGDERMRNLIAGVIDHVATERHYIRKDGSDFWGYLSGRRHADAAGNFINLVGHITDISELRLAVNDLEANRRFLADMIEYSGMLIAVKNRAGRYEIVNRKWEEVTGLSRHEVLGKSDEELFPYPIGGQFRLNDLEAMESDRCIEKEEVLEDEEGGHRYAISVKFPLKAIDGSVRGVCVMSTDITERKQAEEERLKLEQQLLHVQKLESLGVLAGGIAHDFNNILMAIMGNADLALMRINKESPAVENLHRIEQAAARAADLAKQMLAYSGKGKFVVESLNLNILLEEMLHMLEVSISKNVVLRLNPYQQLPPVEADATQIRQIVMNLVINASEAIGDKSGVIAITTGCLDCDRSYLKDVWLDENLTDGLYVYLEIADTGCGMGKEIMHRLFDPFFTTKFTGRGLGMAAVLGIVRSHKGAIKVCSEPDRGTTFKILLPTSGRPTELFNGDRQKDEWSASGTVLLVDDEETVRGIGSEMLKELGYTVITANDGREALEIFQITPDIAFVIMDLTMPHMDGEQCFRELHQLKPDINVILSSGYNEQQVTQKFAGKGLAGFIQKPYRLSTLKEAIRGMSQQTQAPAEG